MIGPEEDRFTRYFEGDLDLVERRELDEDLARSPALGERFAEAYDARTRAVGLRALVPAPEELSECFSPRTLERHARGELAPADASLVSAHLSSTWCAQQVRALQAAESREPSWIERWVARLRAERRWTLAVAVAVALLLFIWIRPRDAEEERFRSQADLGISAVLSAPEEWSITAP